MSYISHSCKTNLDQDTVRSQFIKVASVLVSLIFTTIIVFTGWLLSRDEKFLLSDSITIITCEAAIIIASFAVLIGKLLKIIKCACNQRDDVVDTLKNHEIKLKSIVDNSLIGIIEVNTDGDILLVNDEFLRITGYSYSSEQDDELNWFNITPEKYKDIARETFSTSRNSGSCSPYKAELLCAKGTILKVKISCKYLTDKSNSGTYIISIVEDEKLDKSLINHRYWLEHLLNAIPAPLLLIEPKTAEVIFANIAANKMAGGEFPVGESQQEYGKLYCFKNAEGQMIPEQHSPQARVARGERLDGIEVYWSQGNKNYPVRVFADTLPAIQEYSSICVAFCQDTSKVRNLEKSLRLSQDRLGLLLETTGNLISSEQPEELIEVLYREIAEHVGLDCYLHFLADKDTCTVKLTSHSGISCSQAQNFEFQKLGEGVCGTVAEQSRAIKLGNLGQSSEPETELIRSLDILAFYCCPIIAKGQLLGVVGFGSRTRSDFNDCETGIMQAICNQIAIGVQRANLINSLQEANRIKDEFLAILSHELRSPLNSIMGWAQYLQIRKLDEITTLKALDSIERNSRELHNVIEELLDMSLTIQGKMQFNIRHCNLASIVVEVVNNLRPASFAKQIEIKLSVPKNSEGETIKVKRFIDSSEPLNHISNTNCNSSFPVSGDIERLRQVIWNLISNAIKFTSCGGCIEVSLQKERISENSLSSETAL